jgi:hypothetical protein
LVVLAAAKLAPALAGSGLAYDSFTLHWFVQDPPAVCKVSDEQKAKIKAAYKGWQDEWGARGTAALGCAVFLRAAQPRVPARRDAT